MRAKTDNIIIVLPTRILLATVQWCCFCLLNAHCRMATLIDLVETCGRSYTKSWYWQDTLETNHDRISYLLDQTQTANLPQCNVSQKQDELNLFMQY